MATDFAADWFHPNDRGHRVWADAFWAAMPSGLRQAGRASAS
jgi:vancomycin resistance protein YoaR